MAWACDATDCCARIFKTNGMAANRGEQACEMAQGLVSEAAWLCCMLAVEEKDADVKEAYSWAHDGMWQDGVQPEGIDLWLGQWKNAVQKLKDCVSNQEWSTLLEVIKIVKRHASYLTPYMMSGVTSCSPSFGCSYIKDGIAKRSLVPLSLIVKEETAGAELGNKSPRSKYVSWATMALALGSKLDALGLLALSMLTQVTASLPEFTGQLQDLRLQLDSQFKAQMDALRAKPIAEVKGAELTEPRTAHQNPAANLAEIAAVPRLPPRSTQVRDQFASDVIPFSVTLVSFGLERLDDTLAELVDSLGGGVRAIVADDTLQRALKRSVGFRADVIIDTRSFDDPNRNCGLGHTGHHPDIISRVVRHHTFRDWLAGVQRQIFAASTGCEVKANADLGVALYCKSGKHRSVASSFILKYIFEAEGWMCPEVHHLSQLAWGRYNCCRGLCSECTGKPPSLHAALQQAHRTWLSLLPYTRRLA